MLYQRIRSHRASRSPGCHVQVVPTTTGGTSSRVKCIWERLRLASTRKTTEVEDATYSLLSIFSATGISPLEGSLGHLLAHVFTGSGDVSILAWTGESGTFNNCPPAISRHSMDQQNPISRHPFRTPRWKGSPPRHIPLHSTSTLSWGYTAVSMRSSLLGSHRVGRNFLASLSGSLVFHKVVQHVQIVFKLITRTLTFGMIEMKTRHDLPDGISVSRPPLVGYSPGTRR